MAKKNKVRESVMISKSAQKIAEKKAKEQNRSKHYILSEILESALV